MQATKFGGATDRLKLRPSVSRFSFSHYQNRVFISEWHTACNCPVPGDEVLKIAFKIALDESITLHLDGQVGGLWVELLQRTCEVQLEKRVRVTLDMKNVSFADRDGVALLRSLADRRVEILNALPFIAEQIGKGGRIVS